MTAQSTLSAPVRRSRQAVPNAAQAGLPDPRPVTDYTAVLSTVAGHSRLTITLSQPCVVRTPAWGFVDCTNGSKVFASSVTVVDPTHFYFDFAGTLTGSVAFIDVPYQDMQVQNVQGGFVRSGGQWFRAPVMP